jgi:hypothetical protein
VNEADVVEGESDIDVVLTFNFLSDFKAALIVLESE